MASAASNAAASNAAASNAAASNAQHIGNPYRSSTGYQSAFVRSSDTNFGRRYGDKMLTFNSAPIVSKSTNHLAIDDTHMTYDGGPFSLPQNQLQQVVPKEAPNAAALPNEGPPKKAPNERPNEELPKKAPRKAPPARAVRRVRSTIGRYDVDFTKKLTKAHICCICSRALLMPVQTTCGHRFCKSCLDPILSSDNPVKCPEDDKQILKTFSDICCENEMLLLEVYCNNKINGCEWSSSLKELSDHLAVCQYSLVSCTNPGCTDNTILKIALNYHLTEVCQYRLTPCEHCSELISLAKMQGHINIDCPKVLIYCPNSSCGTTVYRADVDHIHRTCPYAIFPCQYKSYGCDFKDTRRNLIDHLSAMTDKHLELTVQHVVTLENQVKSMTDQFKSMTDQVVSYEKQIDFVHGKIAKVKSELMSKPLDFTQLMDDPRFGNFMRDLVEKKVTERVDSVQKTAEQAKRMSDSGLEKIKILENHTREANKTIMTMSMGASQAAVSMAELDIRLLAVETCSYNGTITFKINHFQRRFKEAQSGRRPSLYSPYFYTARHGYKMCLRVYLNGDDTTKGTALSVFLIIAKGEYDPLLEWPFKHKFTLMVMNQGRPPKGHCVQSLHPDKGDSFQRPINDMNCATGAPVMIKHEELLNGDNGYIRDDNLYIKAIIL